MLSRSRITMEADAREKVINAAKGLTTIEAENAFALSVVESKTLDPQIIAREKSQAVKKGGLLELIDRRVSLESIGGLDLLKDWLLKRRNCFTERAKQYGLPSPSGLLILGIAGTGKSQTAKATAEVLQVPLLSLDSNSDNVALDEILKLSLRHIPAEHRLIDQLQQILPFDPVLRIVVPHQFVKQLTGFSVGQNSFPFIGSSVYLINRPDNRSFVPPVFLQNSGC